METRKITVVSTKTQSKKTIMSNAATLGELKVELTNSNIDFKDMAFFEGVSKTSLVSDDSALPHDIPYKGTITNDLVIMITNSRKKISSGADRKAIYQTIKDLNLQEVCKAKFGKNFTMCKTDDLLSVIAENKKPAEGKPAQEMRAEKPTTGSEAKNAAPVECKDVKARKAITALCDLLMNSDAIDDYDEDDLEKIKNNLSTHTKSDKELCIGDSPYSDAEIDDMMASM